MVYYKKVLLVFLNIGLLAVVVSALPTNYTGDSKSVEPYIIPGKNVSVVLEMDDVKEDKTVENETVVSAPSESESELDGRISKSLNFNETVIQNGSLSNNGNATRGSVDDAPLNLAILPVLGGFVIITILCIKCCNRVKADVIKEREYIEDGKPLFRVEPESHPDYLSSIGSSYTQYSTVTSGYNPYNTVTTLMSNTSTVSETKDMATMVKPRDIWKTMRHTRGVSVPNPDELVRDRVLLENVVEEVKKFKDMSSPYKESIGRPGSSSPKPVPTFDRSLKPHLSSRPMHKSEEILSSASKRRSSKMVTDVDHPSPALKHSVTTDKALGTKDETEALLNGVPEAVDFCSSNESGSEGLTPRTTDTSVESDFPSSTPSSDSVESSSDSSVEVKNNTSLLRSNLKNSGRTRTRSVSFKESDPCTKKSPNKGKQPAVDNRKSRSPDGIEITRSPLFSNKNTVRRFSLSKVTDNGIQCAMDLPGHGNGCSSPNAEDK